MNMHSIHDDQRPIATPEEIIAEAQQGRMFLLADDETRENEGDLILPAQFVTPEAINFMIRHGSGIVCLALDKERCTTLGLSPLPQHNVNRNQAIFTLPIEAREGVSTGVSAADRACTILTAIDPNKGPEDIATPGHVFPLQAREGGVLERAGHTEAAVDIARLAGLTPAAVICELMNEDGSMARMPDIIAFTNHHGIKVGTVADLVAYRRKISA